MYTSVITQPQPSETIQNMYRSVITQPQPSETIHKSDNHSYSTQITQLHNSGPTIFFSRSAQAGKNVITLHMKNSPPILLRDCCASGLRVIFYIVVVFMYNLRFDALSLAQTASKSIFHDDSRHVIVNQTDVGSRPEAPVLAHGERKVAVL